MKKSSASTTIVFLILGILATGCLKTRAELEDTDEKKVMQKQVVEMQRAKADQEAQYQGMESQIRNLNGRIEVLEHKNEMAEKISNDETKKYVALEERVKSLEQALLSTETELTNLKKNRLDDGARDKNAFEEAEEYFQQKSWKRAAALYQKFRETSPRDRNVAMATYKIGICFAELGMPKEARVFLEEAIEKYPGTKTAKLSKAKLAEISKKRQ